MAVYAVGDVQGCVTALEKLLEIIRFEPQRDQLWLTGDLVNRGRHSLETLRLVKGLGQSAVSVLGNHDLHLLAVAAGVRRQRPDDTLGAILGAADRDELLDWLRHRPLVHCDKGLGAKTLMVHAGVCPGWSKKDLVRHAAEVEALLRGDRCRRFLKQMYGRTPARWSPSAERWLRARFITNALTRIRYCDRRGGLDFTHKGPPGNQPKRWLPWFEHPNLKCKKWRIVFGHWSALGFIQYRNVIGLDSGCVWGGTLTAIRLDGEQGGTVWRSGAGCGK